MTSLYTTASEVHYDTLEEGTGDFKPLLHQPSKCQVRTFVVSLVILLLSFLASCSFLIYDHFKYKDTTPPHDVQVWRDTAAIVAFSTSVLFLAFTTIYMYRKGLKDWRLLVVLGLYIICLAWWGVYHWHYTTHHVSPPEALYVLKMIAMSYVIFITVVVILMVILSSPRECCMFLLCCGLAG
jgi:hypothetical protein